MAGEGVPGDQYTPPRANPENLLQIVRKAYEGEIVLPEFQRSFVWSPAQIGDPLASILLGYFISTFLMLDTNAEHPMVPVKRASLYFSLEKNADAIKQKLGEAAREALKTLQVGLEFATTSRIRT